MAKDPVQYMKLLPTQDSRLNIEDAKELLGNLSEATKADRFELVIKSQANRGLELFISAKREAIDSIKKHIYAVSPDLTLQDVKKKTVDLGNPSITRGYSFSRHYAYPLYSLADSTSDTTSKFMRELSQTAEKEAALIKLSVEPIKPLKVWLLRNKLLRGGSPYLQDPGLGGYIKKVAVMSVSSLALILRASVYLLDNLIHSNYANYYRRPKHLKVVNPKSVILLDKLYEPLFKTSLLVSVKSSSPRKASQLMEQVFQSMNGFAKRSGYQQFKPSKRLASADVYSINDLAAIYHIESSELKTGVYFLQPFKSLPVDPGLRRQKLPGDIILGFNNFQGKQTDLTLSREARQRHLYITGATGSGKSTLLANLMLQDIESGQGLSLIDPHGDLASDLLARLPKNRLKDVIYFDPTDHNSRLSINLLELNAKPGTTRYTQEADQLTESIISLFRKVFSGEDSGGHRIEYILRNTIHTALLVPNSTIFTIFRLLTDSSFRLEVIPTIKDQNLANFWRNELGRAGDYQRVKMTAGVTSKIGRFLFSEPSRRVFGQSSTTLDISKVIDDRQILICNFAKGKLGEDGSKLFSAAMLTKLQLAAHARVNNITTQRSDHYLYVDEFQNHAPNSIIQMLSEARKYGLFLTMAEQSPYQQDAQTTNVIMANAGNILCFRTALPKDEGLILPNFENYLSSNDLRNLPAYKFYFKSSAEEVSRPTSGQTYPLKTLRDDEALVRYNRFANKRNTSATKYPKAMQQQA